MVIDITAKTLLSAVPQPDTWFGLKYNMNLYRGCQHQCIYCDSRSECYGIENFADILVKVNALDLLRKELPRKRVVGTIGTGSMSDPYLPLEADRNLTGRALDLIAQHRFPVHIITKSDLVVRDVDTLRAISAVYAAVSFSITTADDALGKQVEPGAPLVSRRFAAMAALARAGILTGVTLMPVLPFIEDDATGLAAIVQRAADCGATYILPAFGMTLRDRQRAYYYAKLDQHWPGLRERYVKTFGARYFAAARQPDRLEAAFKAACERAGVATRMPVYQPPPPLQMNLL